MGRRPTVGLRQPQPDQRFAPTLDRSVRRLRHAGHRAGYRAGRLRRAFLVPGWGLSPICRRRAPAAGAGAGVGARRSQLASQRGGALRMAKALVFPLFLRRFDGFLYVGQQQPRISSALWRPAGPAVLLAALHRQRGFPAAVKPPGAKRRGPERPARLLFVGKLVDSKRPFDLLEAAAKFRGRRVEVAFAGAGEARGQAEASAPRRPACRPCSMASSIRANCRRSMPRPT